MEGIMSDLTSNVDHLHTPGMDRSRARRHSMLALEAAKAGAPAVAAGSDVGSALGTSRKTR
jgi:hypothetical protein